MASPLPKGFIPDKPDEQAGGVPPGFVPDSSAADKQPNADPDIPRATMTAAPTGIVPWFQDAENDLRQGGNRTIVGRALGHMQGNGDKGYSGLQSGVSPETAEYMGSPELGLTRALKGAAEVGTGQIWQGGKDVVSGGLQAATIPSAFAVGPEASAVANKAWEKIPIPTQAKAGKLFEQTMGKAADLPVDTTASSDPLMRAYEMGERGMARPKVVNQMVRRLTSPDAEPMTYREARDFASSLSRQSSTEGQKLTPAMKSKVGELSHAFNEDVGRTAQGAGVGEQYQNAMKGYHRAMQLRKALINTAKVGGGAIATGYLAHRLIPSVLPER